MEAYILVTKNLFEFEKTSGQMKRQLEGTSQEKTELTGRLKELTAKIREMTDDMENSHVRKWKILWKTGEFKVEKAVLTKELTKTKEDLNNYGKEIEKLNKLLDQRYDKPCFAFKITSLPSFENERLCFEKKESSLPFSLFYHRIKRFSGQVKTMWRCCVQSLWMHRNWWTRFRKGRTWKYRSISIQSGNWILSAKSENIFLVGSKNNINPGSTAL